VLEREVEPARVRVENIIEAGTAGTVSALPERFKSWHANRIAFKLAASGKATAAPAAAGDWWQDDSLENELRRFKAYADRHRHTDDLPIRWYLNQGLRLAGPAYFAAPDSGIRIATQPGVFLKLVGWAKHASGFSEIQARTSTHTYLSFGTGTSSGSSASPEGSEPS
jgi:hypothetical protein